MPFRLDDVLHMDWAREHSFWDAFDVQRGEIVRSVRPVFAMTIWILTHTAGIKNYFPWHFVLVGSFLIGLAYAGKTARYIAGDNTALYFSTGFFWLAFLPILNVLFWFGDLTFTVELMFVAPAWYYGLRGILEGRLGLWVIAILAGTLAILAKEPALLLVHSIFVGTFILFFKEIRKSWSKKTPLLWITAILLYGIFLGISLKLYFVSPTRSNRFFSIGDLSHARLMFFVNDRLRYYSEALLNPIARLLLVLPLLYSIIAQIIRKNRSLNVCLVILISAALLTFFLVKSVLVFAVILVLAPLLGFFREKNNKSHKMALLFSISAIIILGVLLITVMLVKTQLTELSFVLLVIAGIYWAHLLKEISTVAKPYLLKKKIIYSFLAVSSMTILAVAYFAAPVIEAKVRLLSDVRDVRNNANDAIKWLGAHLPQNSEVLVTTPGLYGLGSADEMTAKDDEYKLYAQYTFLQGYTRSYFRALNRPDISLGFLEDTVMISRVLDSCRNLGRYYLFLQTGLDRDRFHGSINGKKQLRENDSLLALFSKGPFPSEVWKIGK
ncbi:MAG: hypothetical protein ACHQM6_00580 [Candidatus Kapaibacterium sp.]